MHMQIAEIKAYLKKHKITYEQLAEKTGLSVSTIKKVFAGISQYPRLDTMQAIEQALGINEKSLTELGEADMNVNNISIPEKYSGIRAALSDGDKNLTQDDIDDIIRFINFTANKK